MEHPRGTPVDAPFVSIVVPVLNGERTIGDCLASLVKAEYPAPRREIIVVDSGSTDGTAEVVSRYPVRMVHELGRGPSRARNRGVAEARGEFVAFTDADCTVSATWLLELVGGFESDQVGAVAGEVVAHPPKTAVERYLSAGRPALAAWAPSHPYPWIPFGSVAVRRTVFERLGSFDPELHGGADIDFGWRVIGNGFEIGMRPRALVFRRNPTKVRGLVRERVRYGRGHALLAMKYPDMIRWRWSREPAAWGEVARSGTHAAWAGARALRRRDAGGAEDVRSAAIDLARILGERAGFVDGIVRAGLRRSGFPAAVGAVLREAGVRMGLRLDANRQRRRRLHERFVRRHGLEVRRGPFAGTVYPRRAVGWVTTLVPRLLGAYECELHGIFERAVAEGYDTILDIGAADGFYAVGLAVASPGSSIHAFEPSPGLRRFAREFAELNGVSDRVELHGACDAERLASLAGRGRTFVKVDCEGSEADLISAEAAGRLAEAELVVELHGGERDAPEWLRRRFASTHDIALVTEAARDVRSYPELDIFDDRDAGRLISELRGERALWAHLKPIGRSS